MTTWTGSRRSSSGTTPTASSTRRATVWTIGGSSTEDRSIGSVIKLLTPSPAVYTAEHNAWLDRIPVHVKELVYVIKRAYRPEWGDDWRSHFSVVIINGRQGNSLRLDGAKITVNMLRVGFNTDGSWRLFGLRHDFSPATKVQTQDDITASTVVPGSQLGLDPDRSYKLVENCEKLLFQRPDDAIHRGLRQAGRARPLLARHVHLQLPAADPGRCRSRCATTPWRSARSAPRWPR